MRARPAAAPELSALALESKAYWGYPRAWLEHWRAPLTITPQFVAENDVFVAKIDGEVAGFYAIVAADERFALEHLWVRPQDIGSGFGRALFEHAARSAAARGASCLTIVADPNAAPFYEHLGAKRDGSVVSKIGGTPREIPRFIFDLTRLRRSR